MTRLAVVTTHPVQYQVPWLQALARLDEVQLRVYYAHLPDAPAQGTGFGVPFLWDLPLLEGYQHELLRNRARRPGLNGFWGCHTPALLARLRAFAPDVVLVHGWHTRTCLQALAAGRRLAVPVIVRGESNDLRRRPAWVKAIQRLLLARYSAFLAIGQANAAFYLARGMPAARVFPAPYCVDNARFRAGAEQAQPRRLEIRARWGISPEAYVALFCGKLIQKKRPHDLLRAASRARQQGASSLHVLAVGDGELRQSCVASASAEGLPLSWTGFLNQGQIAEAYVAADVLVLPSDSGETWGLVVNEAMACGLSALVSDQVGCHPDLVIDEQTGRTFSCGNTEQLASQLLALARDPRMGREWGAAARRHVFLRYGLSQAVDGTRAALAFVRAAQAPLHGEARA